MAPRFGQTEMFERPALLAPIEKIGGRSLLALHAAVGGALPDGHNAVILPVGQRTQQHTVYHAEDRRVRGNAERQDEYHHKGETWLVDQGADAGSHIANKVFHRSLTPASSYTSASYRVHLYRIIFGSV